MHSICHCIVYKAKHMHYPPDSKLKTTHPCFRAPLKMRCLRIKCTYKLIIHQTAKGRQLTLALGLLFWWGAWQVYTHIKKQKQTTKTSHPCFRAHLEKKRLRSVLYINKNKALSTRQRREETHPSFLRFLLLHQSVLGGCRFFLLLVHLGGSLQACLALLSRQTALPNTTIRRQRFLFFHRLLIKN